MIGIGIGRQTHTVVILDGEEKEYFLPNNWEGVERVKEILGQEKKVVFLGNYRWAIPFAYALQKEGITPLYYPIKTGRGTRGRIGQVAELLKKAFNSGVPPRPFFPPSRQKVEPELSLSYRLALEYLEDANKVREAKHHLLDCLALLFPEVVKAGTTFKLIKGKLVTLPVPEPQPPDIFTAKMRPVLENPDPSFWASFEAKKFKVPDEIRILAQNSLGRLLPSEIREKTLTDHRKYLQEYDRARKFKKVKLRELKKKMANHRLVHLYGQGDVITLLAAFLGWRAWPNWRELRRFCGLDVSRLDSQGRPRISRVRPEIRQYLYLFASRTTEGKKVTAGVKGRVKRIEKVLKHLWKEELKQPLVL